MSATTPRRQAGFTLLEVMIALAILFTGLVLLLKTTAENTRATARAKFLTAATHLARGKMLDIEEELLHEGFQDTHQELDGDFSEEGFPKFTWKATIEAIELPPLSSIQTALGSAGAEGEGEGEDGEGGGPGGLLGMMGGMDTSSAGGMGMVMAFWDTFQGILEAAIRRVTLTVTWSVGGREESLVVTAYFTEPKAVDEAMGSFGNPNPSPEPDDR